MNAKEWFRFISGLIMGTSVPYLKPSIRYLWPTAIQNIDPEFNVFLGGSCVCGILTSENKSLIIDTNSGAAAAQLKTYIEKDLQSQVTCVINTSEAHDFSDGNRFYTNAKMDRSVQAEQTIDFANEKLHVISCLNSYSAIYLEKRKTLFLGALFYNKIHPILRDPLSTNVQVWIQKLEELMARFQPDIIVPAEGDLAEAKDVLEFISYLKYLSDPKVEFSECRQRFDWIEIPGQTSLEENFDFLRKKYKTHTTF